MRSAKVRVSWALSPSPDVVNQKVVVTDETSGDVLLDQMLSAVATEVVFDVPEKTDVSVSVVATDGTFDSDASVLSFSVGDLQKPQPVTDLAWEILEVLDTEVQV